MENEEKRFYLKVKGQEVEVSEAVYRAYKRADRAERKRKQRMWRCLVPREKARKSFLKRCTKDCSRCPYGVQAKNSIVSLDGLREDGYEETDCKQDVESDLFAEEEKQALYQGIRRLSKRQQEIIRLIYFEEKSQEDVADILGITQGTVSVTLERAVENLKKIIKI